jgi:hypothetical protein
MQFYTHLQHLTNSVEHNGGVFQNAIFALCIKFALCAHPICTNLLKFGIVHLPHTLNLLHFHLDLSDFYALHCAPNLYEINPRSWLMFGAHVPSNIY